MLFSTHSCHKRLAIHSHLVTPIPHQPWQVGVTTPHLFGTHNWRDSLPPIDPTIPEIFM